MKKQQSKNINGKIKKPEIPLQPTEIAGGLLVKFFLAILVIFLGAFIWYLFQNSSRIFRPTDFQLYLPEKATVLFNLKRLFEFQGTYAKFLWGWITFISMSSIFLFLGGHLLRRILTFRSRNPLLTANSPEFSQWESVACSWLLGSWCCSMVWFFLGIFGLYKQSIATSLIFLGLALSIAKSITFFKNRRQLEGKDRAKLDLISLAIVLVGVWIFSWSLLCVFPQYYWDTLMINLALPGYYAAEGKLVANPFHIYSYHPQNSEVLQVWALLVHSKEAAFLLVWGFLVSLLVFIFGWIRRISSSTAALCTIILFVSSALGVWLGTLVKNDLQPAIFLILQWWALMVSFRKVGNAEEGVVNWLFLAGLFAGIACGHKFTAAPPVLITFIGLFIYLVFNYKAVGNRLVSALKLQSIFGLGLVIAWAPWLIRNLWISGNPIYPFLNNFLHIPFLYPWHSYLLTSYDLKTTGWAGFKEYFINLIQLKQVGLYGNVGIWWGPTALLCLSGLLCLGRRLPREVRYVTGLAMISWIFSLLFALKPPYHAGPLIFILCCCFGIFLSQIFMDSRFKYAQILIILVGFAEIVRTIWTTTLGKLILFSISILLSGAPPWHFSADFSAGTPHLATIDELSWIHYLVNTHTAKDEKVLFMGSMRPAGIERRHYASFSVSMQPILYFAQQSKDELDLRDKMLSLGIRHIVYDPRGWNDWVQHQTVDGPHNIPIASNDLEKINRFMQSQVQLRMKDSFNKIGWYSIKKEPGEPFPPVPYKTEDIYEFPYHYLNLANQFMAQGKTSEATEILRVFKQLPWDEEFMKTINLLAQPLGLVAS